MQTLLTCREMTVELLPSKHRSTMKLITLQIKNYRSIADTTKFSVGDVTCQ
jgi:hypothetical protein